MGVPQRRLYLRTLCLEPFSVQFSSGAQRRAGQLQGFLKGLHEAAQRHLALGPLELLVLNQQDWQKLERQPYGLAVWRRKRQTGTIVMVAADYPERVLHRFDVLLLKAGQAGFEGPGDLKEFLDLLLARAWAGANLFGAGLCTRIFWLDEILKSFLVLLCLKDAGWETLDERFIAWGQVELAGGESLSLDEAGERLSFAQARWLEGAMSSVAAKLARNHSWDLLKMLQKAELKNADSEAIFALEPELKAWLSDLTWSV